MAQVSLCGIKPTHCGKCKPLAQWLLKVQMVRWVMTCVITAWQIVSNGVYRSIEHRATVNLAKERLSVATFYSSNLNSELGPAGSIIGPHNPPCFRREPTEQYFKGFFARKLYGKSYLEVMRLEQGESNPI